MQDKGFFGSLFDVSFRSFVTTKIITVLFVIALVLSGIYTLFIVVTAFAADSGLGVLVLVLSPLIYLLLVVYSRVLLEFVIIVFRIYENTSVMARQGVVTGAEGPPSALIVPPSSPPPAGPETPGPQSPQG